MNSSKSRHDGGAYRRYRTMMNYRTFLEVEQPASDFVFRVGESRGEPTFKLTEADGGRWKLDAMANIKMYLEAALENIQCEKKITVIA